MLFKKENYDNVEMNEIAEDAAKKVFIKGKDKLLEEFGSCIARKIDEYLKNKLEMKSVNLKYAYDELERDYYYKKGKGILTQEEEIKFGESTNEIEDKIKKIDLIKEVLCD